MSKHEKFETMVNYARLPDDHFGPPPDLICAACDHELVFTGTNEHVAWIECKGCGLAYTAKNDTNVNLGKPPSTAATHTSPTEAPVSSPNKPMLPADMVAFAEHVLPKGLIEWALEKGRREAEISFPRPGANVEQLEADYREWLKNNPEPKRG